MKNIYNFFKEYALKPICLWFLIKLLIALQKLYIKEIGKIRKLKYSYQAQLIRNLFSKMQLRLEIYENSKKSDLLFNACKAKVWGDGTNYIDDETYDILKNYEETLEANELENYLEYLKEIDDETTNQYLAKKIATEIYFYERQLQIREALYSISFSSESISSSIETNKENLFREMHHLYSLAPEADFFNHKSLKKDFKNIRKTTKRFDKAIKENTSIRVDLDFNEIIKFLPILPVLFIIGSYMNLSLYFGHFDINIGDYFSISDYLSVSIEVMESAILSTFISFIAYCYGIWVANSVPEHQEEQFQKTTDRQLNLLLGMLIFGTIMAFVFHEPYINSLSVALLISPMFLSGFLSKYFIEPRLKNSLIIIFLATFLIQIWLNSSTNIENIYKKISSDDCLSIVFKENAKNTIDPCEFVLLGFNSQFIFLISKGENQSVIFNRDQVESSIVEFEKSNTDYPILLSWLREKIRKWIKVDEQLGN